MGGLLAATHIGVAGADSTRASTAAVKPCSSTRTRTVLGHSISWIYCYTTAVTLGPWQSSFFGMLPPHPRCPAPWQRHVDLANRAVGGILGYLYPAALYAEPTSAWAWGSFLGLVTNWQFSGSITVQWQYNCYQIGS